MTFKIGQLLAWAGARRRAIELLGASVEQGFFCAPCLRGEGLAERLAEEPDYRRLVSAAEARGRAFEARFRPATEL